MFRKIKDWVSGWVDAFAPDYGNQEVERRRMERHAAIVRLRDEFAMAALSSMLSHPQNMSEGTPALAAEWAYKFSDAMMKERGTDRADV